MVMSGAPRRVVVTGMGVVTPIGTTVADFWAGCRQSRVGVGPLGGFPLEDLKILIAAQIKEFDHKASQGIGVSTSGAQQLGGRAVIEEPR